MIKKGAGGYLDCAIHRGAQSHVSGVGFPLEGDHILGHILVGPKREIKGIHQENPTKNTGRNARSWHGQWHEPC